ncbi:MAG: hypothetical protein WCI18_16100 [Pseudomonadota bacterium]
MATVELRPGDTLNIVWTAVQVTPLGLRETESKFAFTYEDLLSKLRSKTTEAKSRKSGTEGARFSRIVALATNALVKGKWSTGADIDRTEVFERLKRKFLKLDQSEFVNITENAKNSLKEIFYSDFLSTEQKAELKPILLNAGIKL